MAAFSDSLPKHQRAAKLTLILPHVQGFILSYVSHCDSGGFLLLVIYLKGQFKAHLCKMLWLSLWEITRSWERLRDVCFAFCAGVCGSETYTVTYQLISAPGVLDVAVICNKNETELIFFYFVVFVVVKKLERQRALDCRQSFLHCCQPCCLPIVLTSQHTHAQIHTETMVKSLSEIRLTSCLFNPLWRSENANTHTKTVLELLGHSVTA